jgi:CheY-like chemotaxis protein
VVGLAPGQPAYRILIAEDNQDNQQLLSKLMTGIGLDVKVADNGEVCVKLFQEWCPHLIWMDRRMPVMDGVEAAHRIRQLLGGEAMKIVAVTASAFKEQQEMLGVGMDDFVSKPYRFEEIYGCLARQLGVTYVTFPLPWRPRRPRPPHRHSQCWPRCLPQCARNSGMSWIALTTTVSALSSARSASLTRNWAGRCLASRRISTTRRSCVR